MAHDTPPSDRSLTSHPTKDAISLPLTPCLPIFRLNELDSPLDQDLGVL